MSEITPICKNCRFFDSEADDDRGRGGCRRYPATVIVTTSEWCGEWLASKEKLDEALKGSLPE